MMAADILTKSLSKGPHSKCMTLMGQLPNLPDLDATSSTTRDTQIAIVQAILSHHLFWPSYYPPSIYSVPSSYQ